MAMPIRYRGYAFHHTHQNKHRRPSHSKPPVSPRSPKSPSSPARSPPRSPQPPQRVELGNIVLEHDAHDYAPGGCAQPGHETSKEYANLVQYEIRVFTGDVMGAGTDANVYLTLYGTDGDTGRQQLTKRYTNLFERGRTDCFIMDLQSGIGKLTKLRIQHDDTGFGAAWLLDRVEIVNTATNITTVFLCGEWLDSRHGTMRDLLPEPEDLDD